MPGHMGVEQRTVKNVWIYKIDPARNLLWVKGQVRFSYPSYILLLFASLVSKLKAADEVLACNTF